MTPAEHLRLPDIEDVREGVIATRIAAHSGDLVKGVRAAKVWNDQMSRYRKALNWEGMYAMAMDPDKARRYKEESEASGSNVCRCAARCARSISTTRRSSSPARHALGEAEAHAARLRDCARATTWVRRRRSMLHDQHGKDAPAGGISRPWLVVYFYPDDDTPGCTVEGKEFRDLDEAFHALECAVVGVSVDSVESHRAFAEKHAFPFTLLSDPEGELASAFGVLRNGSRRARPS